jgi:hypothetical protein
MIDDDECGAVGGVKIGKGNFIRYIIIENMPSYSFIIILSRCLNHKFDCYLLWLVTHPVRKILAQLDATE